MFLFSGNVIVQKKSKSKRKQEYKETVVKIKDAGFVNTRDMKWEDLEHLKIRENSPNACKSECWIQVDGVVDLCNIYFDDIPRRYDGQVFDQDL